MAGKRHNAFKKLMQKAEIDRLPPAFTGIVMNDIRSEVQQEVVVDAKLKLLLQKSAIHKASDNLTANVMARVEQSTRRSDKPIITPFAWGVIFVSFLLLIVLLVLLTSHSEQHIISDSLLQRYFTDPITINIPPFPSEYMIILIAVSGLLVVDYIIRTNTRNVTGNK